MVMVIMSILSLMANPAEVQVVINEVMANPKGSESGGGSPGDRNEFIELYNVTDDTVDLATWVITDLDDDDVISRWTDGLLLVKYPSVRIRSTLLMPHSFALILDPEYTSADTVGGIAQPYEFPEGTLILTVKNTTVGNGLANNDPVVLKDKSGSTISTFGTPESEDDFPDDAGDGKSWERMSPPLPDTKTNWRISSDPSGSTPGRESSAGIDEKKRKGSRYGFILPVPNPWMGIGTFRFFLPEASEISVAVYTSVGRFALPIFSGMKTAGYHELGLPALQLGAGCYFLCLKTQKEVAVAKIVIVK